MVSGLIIGVESIFHSHFDEFCLHGLPKFVEVDPGDSRLISEAFKKSPMKIGRSSSRQDQTNQTEEVLRSESKPE